MAIPNISLEQYLGFVNLIELKKGIKTNSSATLDFALQYYKNQVEEADAIVNKGITNPSETFDVRAEMVDRRVTTTAKELREGLGNTYQIFSDNYVAKYNMLNWWSLKLDMFSIIELLNKDFSSSASGSTTTNGAITLPDGILAGEIKRITIDSENGEQIVTFDNPNNLEYEVFTMHDETISVNDRIDKIDKVSFKISLYSFASFEKTKLNASVSPIEMSYMIVFNNGNEEI